MLVSRATKVALQNVITHVLDHILNAVHKAATGNQRETASDRKEHHQHENDGNAHPKDVLGQARLTTTKHETWEEVMNNLVDFLTKVRE